MRTGLGLALALAIGFGCAAGDGSGSWATMDHDERIAFMANTVEPTMRALFVEYDPVRFADFGCATCHGADAAARDYAMPNDVFPLPRDGTLDAARAADEAMTDFMLAEVFPTFVDLIGETKYAHDANPDGYRCTGCHAVAE